MGEGKVVDKFEYKGKNFNVVKEEDSEYYFEYKEKDKKIRLSFSELKSFISGPFSHTTIGNNPVDMIERSVKINDLLFNLKDLENKLKKYN